MKSFSHIAFENLIKKDVDLITSVNEFNSKVILLIGIPYTLFELVGLTLSYMGFFATNIRAYVWAIVIFHLIYLPILIIDQRKNLFKNVYIRKTYHNIYGFVLLFWGTLFTQLQYSGNEDITIFSIVIILISAVFWYSPYFIIPTNCLMLLYLITGISQHISDPLLVNAIMYKGFIITALSSIIAFSRFFSKQKMFYLEVDLRGKNEYLTELSLRDSLTKLYNNRYIFEKLNTITENIDYQENLCLVMLDLDNFKGINDSFGHLVGDRVLIDVADILMDTQDSSIIPGRYGGEEFIIILKSMNEHQAMDYAESIRQRIEALSYQEAFNVTASIGLTCLRQQQTITEFIRTADDNLYQAKALGKNQIAYK